MENYTSNIWIYGTSGNDNIENTGNYVTLQSLEGNDSITNYGNALSVTRFSADKYALIFADEGNDSIYNSEFHN